MSHSKSDTFGNFKVYFDPEASHIDEAVSYLHGHTDSRGALLEEAQSGTATTFITSNNHQFRLKKKDGYLYLDPKSLY
jgi:hypothetical protein